jgi:hypothetical protein
MGLDARMAQGWCDPDDPEPVAELTGRQYGFNVRNEIVLEKKEDMKKRGISSPDNADGLALTFACPVPDLSGGSPLYAPRWAK